MLRLTHFKNAKPAHSAYHMIKPKNIRIRPAISLYRNHPELETRLPNINHPLLKNKTTPLLPTSKPEDINTKLASSTAIQTLISDKRTSVDLSKGLSNDLTHDSSRTGVDQKSDQPEPNVKRTKITNLLKLDRNSRHVDLNQLSLQEHDIYQTFDSDVGSPNPDYPEKDLVFSKMSDSATHRDEIFKYSEEYDYNFFLAQLDSVGLVDTPRIPDKSALFRYKLHKFQIDKIRMNSQISMIKTKSTKELAKYKNASKHQKQPTVFDDMRPEKNSSGYSLGRVLIQDEITGTAPFNSVFIHNEHLQGDSHDKHTFEYVTLRKILSEISVRDARFVPDEADASENFEGLTKLAVSEAVKNTFAKNKNSQRRKNRSARENLSDKINSRPSFSEIYNNNINGEYVTKNDSKSEIRSQIEEFNTKNLKLNNTLKVVLYPSDFESRKERFDLYKKYAEDCENGGYLVILDHPQNHHLIQEARGYLLTKNGFYANEDEKMPDMFTFAPCPHDKSCPLPFPCRHKISHTNGVSDQTSKVKFHEYSYVVFRVGKTRKNLMFETYKKETLERLKSGGKQYRVIFGFNVGFCGRKSGFRGHLRSF